MEDTNSAQGAADIETTETGRRPWDRLKTETAAEFAMFEAYLRQPAPRSARQLARATGQPSARTFDRVRGRNEWLLRAAAFDEWRLNEIAAAMPRDESNPYKALLDQSARRGQKLHEAAELLLGQCTRVLQHAERTYLTALAKEPQLAPPTPPPAIVSAIRGAAEVMDKASEAQALCLGISDVLKMQAEGDKAK